jgi:hypothetical protein
MTKSVLKLTASIPLLEKFILRNWRHVSRGLSFQYQCSTCKYMNINDHISTICSTYRYTNINALISTNVAPVDTRISTLAPQHAMDEDFTTKLVGSVTDSLYRKCHVVQFHRRLAFSASSRLLWT